MNASVDNYKLRSALLARGFEDITSVNRSTKSWKLRHPGLRHWVSIKLSGDARQPMSTAPLVIHPDDAERVKVLTAAMRGVVLEIEPYKGSSTKYENGVLGRAVSLADEAAVDAFVAALTNEVTTPAPPGPQQSSPSDLLYPDTGSNDIDPLLLSAAAAEVDAELVGQSVSATTRQQLVEARLGQGKFRKDMMRIWGGRCAVTGCGIGQTLVASHAIAWRDSTDPKVRLDPYNGLLLTASVDRLFDQGLISFAADGRLLRRPGLPTYELAILGLGPDAGLRMVDERHLPYLTAHRARHGI